MRKGIRFLALMVMTLMASLVIAQHPHGDAVAQQAEPPADSGMEHSASQMSSHHLESSSHMKMTPVRAVRAGDQQRADQILASAREAAEKYRDYKVALADGFQIFLPDVPQKMYHFTNYRYGFEATFALNPEHPTSLLYEKQGDSYKLIGVMYTAPKNSTQEELDSRIPLSIAQWHAHVNFCAPPREHRSELFQPNSRFGLQGSITTQDACEQAGGKFSPQVFGWMVHVYPFEKETAQIWSVERQMAHDHGHMH